MNEPVLVEREGYLETLRAALPTGGAADGRMVLVGGEAGIGKSSLVRALIENAAWVTVRRGFCDGVTPAAALGPVAEAMPELEAAVEAVTPENRRHLFREVLALLGSTPTVLVLEDVHWADEATLDLVRFLGRRVSGLPVLVVVTFRDDEAEAASTLTTMLGELAALPSVQRMHLPGLSPAAVASLVSTSGRALPAGSLHRRTGGNPFFVTEVLATGSSELPATVRDAVLARIALLSPAAREVLAAAAVLGPQADLGMLTAVSGQPGSAVDECVARGVLVVEAEADTLSFRHDVARETVERSLPPAERVRMHAVALAELTRAGSRDHRRLAHHADGSGDGAAFLRHGLAAAARSARLGAHQEAVQLYRRAVRFADLLDVEDAAALHESLAYECYLTDRVDEAVEARRAALDLRLEAGDLQGVGSNQRWLSRLSWFAGNGGDADRYADQAVATLDALAPTSELAMAYSTKAQLAMLAGREDDAVAWGQRAVLLAHTLGDRTVESHALNNVGTAQAQGHDPVNGLARLRHSLDIALADDLHEHAARAYTNLAASLVCLHRYGEADPQLETGTSYCTERDLDAWRLYMSAWQARSCLEQGRYDEAAEVAEAVLRVPGVASVARIPALAVAGQLAARRGQDAGEALLEEARVLARATREAQRILPVSFARAEAAWLAGDPGRVADELVPALALPEGLLDPWERGELAWWVAAAGGRHETGGDVAEPFALMLDHRWAEASRAWREVGCPLWAALSLTATPDLDEARSALAVLDELGAAAVRSAVLRERHAAGLPVPRAPRRATQANPVGLTARELEVLGLLAEGLSNAEMARRLFLSGKTVGHHVSAVLRKLGEPSRARAVAAAHRQGLLDP